MERPGGLIPFVVVSLLAGGALVPHLTSGTHQGQAAGKAEDKKSGTERATAPLSNPGVEPFIERLADFFRLEIGEADLIREAPHQLDRMTSASSSDGDLTPLESAQFVRCLFNLNLAVSPSELRAFHKVLQPLGTCSHPEMPKDREQVRKTAARLAPFVRTYAEPAHALASKYSRNVPADTKAHVKTLLAEAASSARRTMAFLRVRAASRKYFNGGIQFIIATVPDPIDSHAGWQFDPAMAAIQEAAGANEFVLDRFYIPDADTNGAQHGATPAASALHESQPGVVLFRSTAAPLEPGPLVQSLTVLFVVTETPTAGLNSRAFAAAVRAISSWDFVAPAPQEDTGVRSPLLILGPYFSGTSQSMARALADLKTEIGHRDVKIISGTATSDSNKDTLESAFGDRGVTGPGAVRFHATVRPDKVITSTIVYYLGTMVDPQVNGERPRIARLLESNTSYGVGIDQIDDTRYVRSDAAEYIDLHFPLHISRLRSEARDRSTPAQAPSVGIVSRFHPLALGDESRPIDQLPIFTPQTTTGYVELVLARILEVIRREQIHIIGIMATDARDKLFLARQISRDVPNAILYTTESDMLYVHPDFLDATAGMLIASSYPLYSRDRIVIPGGRHDRRQFATSGVEGVYNAMLALMKNKPAGPPLAQPAPDPPLVDYGAVGGACLKCGPPVWISVVGQGAAWPLAASWAEIWTGPAGYLFPYSPATDKDQKSVGLDADERTTMPAVTQLVFLGMLALAVGHILQAPRIHKDSASDLYVVAATLCLLIPWLFVSFVALSWIAQVQAQVRDVWLFIGAAIVSALVFAALAYLLVTRLVRGKGLMRHRAGWIVGIAVAAWAIVALVQWLQSSVPYSVLFVERLAMLTNGVSPAVPVLGLSAALYLWAVIELRRLARPKILPAEGYEYLESMVDGSLQSLPNGLDYLKRSIISVPAPAAAALALGTVIAFVAAGFDPYWFPLRSIDGPHFGRFVTLLLTTVQLMIAAALFQFLHIWFAIATMLERLATVPTASAFKRLPRKLFPQGVLQRVPRLSELQEAVKRWDRLESEEGLPHASENVTAVFREDMQRNPHQFWSQTNTWKAVLVEARRILDELSVKGMGGSMAVMYPKFVPLQGVGSSVAGSELYAVSQVASDDPHRSRQEEFVVLPIVYMIRAALARMWDNVLFVIGALLLLLGIHASYPFQLNRRLEGFLWTDVAVGVAAVLFVFVRMERDEVLSNIQSSTPGQIKWDRDFIVKLVVYGLIPIAGLFAAEFPEIGGTVLSWIQPFQKALP